MQRGIALIIALVLLLVMTMVAVVAMRTTTLDMKMTTNSTLGRRAFQNSEGARVSLGDVIEDHVFYKGWPDTHTGGTVPVSSGFVIPAELQLNHDGSLNWYISQNGVLYDNDGDTDDEGVEGTNVRLPDIKFRAELDGSIDDRINVGEMFADMWVTRIGTAPGAGSSLDVKDVASGNFIYFDVRSEGNSLGNASARTGADYRTLLQ